MTDKTDPDLLTDEFTTYTIQVPKIKQLEALRKIERHFGNALREIRDEARQAISWAEQKGGESPRYVRIKEACDDALEFQRAVKRKAKTEYARERGGLERFGG